MVNNKENIKIPNMNLSDSHHKGPVMQKALRSHDIVCCIPVIAIVQKLVNSKIELQFLNGILITLYFVVDVEIDALPSCVVIARVLKSAFLLSIIRALLVIRFHS